MGSTNQETSAAEVLPLAGIRVCDLTWIVAGPQATRILADFGAEVIRVEHGQSLDAIRFAPPIMGEQPSGSNSGTFNYFNRNKKSVLLNVRHPMGRDVLKRLIAASDVVVENYSSRVMESWELDYPQMRELNPRVIYCSISGFGHSGRDRDHSTWGPTAQALSGLTYMSGLPDMPSAGWGFSYLDHTAGFYGAIAILMALHHRRLTGEGQHIDISQVETGIALAGPAVLDGTVNGRGWRRPGMPPGNRSGLYPMAPHNTYRCAGDDRWIAITVRNDAEWQALVRAMGEPAWSMDQRFDTLAGRLAAVDEIDRRIEDWTRDREDYAVMRLLQAAGVPAGVCQKPEDRREHDPQLAARGWWREAVHDEIGPGTFDGFVPALSRTPSQLRTAAPVLGAHTYEVMREIVGMSDEEYADHEAAAVFM
jgi:crotonobetainyl-CoA:carnitine CoA-transferase CaiB-like acyl-CoA transferase